MIARARRLRGPPPRHRPHDVAGRRRVRRASATARLAARSPPRHQLPLAHGANRVPGHRPGEVENLVTRPVEEAVGVLRGLQSIHSVSRAGVSEVTLEFDWGSDMDELSMDVREKLDRLVLPDEAENPIVLRFDPALDPIVRSGLHRRRRSHAHAHASRTSESSKSSRRSRASPRRRSRAASKKRSRSTSIRASSRRSASRSQRRRPVLGVVERQSCRAARCAIARASTSSAR